MKFGFKYPALGSSQGVAQPLRFNGACPGLRRPLPMHGEHNDGVLRELGYGSHEIDAFRTVGTVELPAKMA